MSKIENEKVPMNSEVLIQLDELEACLKAAGLWQDSPISAEALSSVEPFCCDTMAFEQWLQFVFLNKIRDMVAKGEALPTNMAIAPMAEMVLSDHLYFNAVHQCLKNLDSTFAKEC
ncbi:MULTISPECIES: YqcC family protein [Pseudoalteromonas]|nr:MULTISPECIES: YqcC family protein [Pseudoalteromonas]MDW7547806.1 YqcC family protein [Pseudoalteromonas peptidolytica]